MQIADWQTRILVALCSWCALAMAYSGGPPDGKTGRPGEGTCNDCHAGVGSADSTELAGLVGNWYQPDSLYSLTLSVRYAGQSRWGFELTIVDQANNSAGQLTVTDSTNTQYSSSPPGYLKHRSSGTHPGTPGPTTWTFGWRAPAAGAGAVRFYWCANAANNDNGNSGDRICRDSLVVSETGVAEPGSTPGRHFWRYASPARNRVVISYWGPAGSPVRIYAGSGRLVRTLISQPDGELVRVVWNGRDAAGRLVPPAAYFVRFGEEISSVARIQFVR
ncbi:hypothetical protein FJY68_00630 [candidate division WOR-3 bacterium]|uniref:Reelin domain-containing protein n=1 Tax=candidate division WOR-3 bacterium TaxID=2052148 RepID=A0A937XC90_UNCW3|nr:hypothetical protein [candidate division WOR-3 bacterium]